VKKGGGRRKKVKPIQGERRECRKVTGRRVGVVEEVTEEGGRE